jgi:hypothetical protein
METAMRVLGGEILCPIGRNAVALMCGAKCPWKKSCSDITASAKVRAAENAV